MIVWSANVSWNRFRRSRLPPNELGTVVTDVTGINGEDGRLVSTLTKRDAERLIKAGVIDGGMLPKVESSLRALTGGAQKAHIIDGRVPHAILLEVLTKEGIGTEIVL